MKIYFGQTEIDEFGSDGLVQCDGGYYTGVVEFGTNPGGIEDVMISDGCGRRIPISVDHLQQLISALGECATLRREIDEGEQLRADVESDGMYGTVCEFGHIHY